MRLKGELEHGSWGYGSGTYQGELKVPNEAFGEGTLALANGITRWGTWYDNERHGLCKWVECV